MTVFNKKNIDFTKNKIFFGEELNTQRFDEFKYPIFDKLTQTQLGFFWRPEEVSLQKDRNDYAQLNDAQKHIFTSNLRYQTLLDSVQGRAPSIAFLPFVTIPELESCIITWDFMETIHSRSYTHIIKNIYSNPSDIFDTIIDEPAIVKRAEMVTEKYDKFIELGRRRLLGLKVDDYELYKSLYLALISVNILEGVRFFVSFACSFAFGELKTMEGSAKIISFIARDEAQHLAITQHILKCYKNQENDSMMTKVMKDCESEVYDMYRDAVAQEKEWAEFLFKEGSMIGLSVPLLGNYIEYICNKRLRAIGLDPIFNVSSANNPLPWTKHWFNSRGLQNAPQETEIESYVIGGIKQDVDDNTFDNFTL
jgi:ribonucleoside-diphosphate reductase beta chain|tara:strand:- start:409 stop:1506 length:1098 start_codon:yes stop_codon:yes gene_type:complete